MPSLATARHLAPDIRDFGLSLRAANKKPKTIRTYTDAACWLAEAVADVCPTWEAVSRQHIRTHLAGIAERYSPAYTSNQFRALQQFFIFLTDEGLITDNPMLKMKPPHVPQKLVPVVSDELDKLADTMTTKRFSDVRDRAILYFFASSGARLSEVAGLRVSDIDLDQLCAIVTGKAGRMRVVRFDAATAMHLNRYLRARKKRPNAGSEMLWLSQAGVLTASGIYQIFTRRAKRAGTQLNPHRLRHNYAHTWLARGGQENDLLQLAGWSSVSMLRRYGASAAAERAAANYDKVMGRLRQRVTA